MSRTADDAIGEALLGWVDMKRRVKFGDETSERVFGQKLINLFEAKRREMSDKAEARRVEDKLLREWNANARHFKLSAL